MRNQILTYLTLILLAACGDEIQHIDSPYAIFYPLPERSDSVRFDPGGTLYYRSTTSTVELSFPLMEQTRSGFWFNWNGARIDGMFRKTGVEKGSADGGTPSTRQGTPYGCE